MVVTNVQEYATALANARNTMQPWRAAFSRLTGGIEDNGKVNKILPLISAPRWRKQRCC
ncbi:hypothetical protein CCM_03888 [Cordyceps militaris CM01]|uniref:Uncharacterized protein n=1 Tax=Cordyceps militaris (strain CM01) TaxID=983644 RepID=G3JCY7_CORMM|nr:uncharacterized protein CCM_03888 [Cordyceps militaris CM01]EGX92515.1 hypothetical protein CCM_03888 [Cordyceps militaris CM01]